MKLDIKDINKFIKVNNLEEVTNPITFNLGNIPTDDGILSYKIFGLSGSYDRKTIFAYIDLKKHFLHPYFYKILTQMDRRFIKIVNGSSFYRIENGKLIEDRENGNTGLDWLYKNFHLLNFDSSDSEYRNKKISLFKSMKKDEIFVNKWLVIPAHYRDVNLNNVKIGRISLDKINDHYISLLSMAQSASEELDFIGFLTEARIQQKLIDIYEYFISYIGGGTVQSEGITRRGKHSLVKKDLLAKTVDYSYRGVVSAPNILANDPNKQLIKFTYIGVPLSAVCVLFFPFFQYYIKSWLEDTFIQINEIKDNKGKLYKLSNPMSLFTPEKIKRMINLFIKSPNNRLDPIKVKVIDENNKEKKVPLKIYESELKRNFTLLDLMYISAVRITKDKHVFMTRYPVDNVHSEVPFKIQILTTYETQSITIENEFFSHYPVISKDELTPNLKNLKFIDTIIPHGTTLEASGMDFDGDTVSLRSVYSVEANQECDTLIKSPFYTVDVRGNNIKTIKNEGIQTLYNLTKD